MILSHIADISGVVVLLSACMVGLTQLRTNLLFFSLQTLVLGCLAVEIGRERSESLIVVVGCAVIVLKALAIPIYLSCAAKAIGCRRDVGQIVAPPLLMFLALGGIVVLMLARPFRAILPDSAIPAFCVISIGMLLMVTRRLAISQIVGFLIIENGIFLFTIGQLHSMPAIVEIGVLLDALGASMLAGLLAFKINGAFEHIDISRLKDLRG